MSVRTRHLVPAIALVGTIAACEPPARRTAPAPAHDPSVPAVAPTLVAFPGFRPSTPAERSARLAIAGMPVSEEARRTEWRVDLDGDGRVDRLLVLVSTTDPSSEILAVLHADSTSHRIATVSGVHSIRPVPAGEVAPNTGEGGWTVEVTDESNYARTWYTWVRSTRSYRSVEPNPTT